MAYLETESRDNINTDRVLSSGNNVKFGNLPN